MRNTHTWKHTTADGDKREVRAGKFGKQWRIQSRLKHEEQWTYHETPPLEDLVELRRVLWNKYQRKHLAFEDVAAVEKLILDSGGSWDSAPDGERGGSRESEGA